MKKFIARSKTINKDRIFSHESLKAPEGLRKKKEEKLIRKFKFKSYDFIHRVTGKTIRVYGMKHVAYEEQFNAVNAAIARDHAQGFVVHVEGLQGAPNYMAPLKKFYSAIAEEYEMIVQKYEGYPFTVYDAHWRQLHFVTKVFLKHLMRFLNWLLENAQISDFLPGGVEAFDKATNNRSFASLILSFVLGGPRETVALQAAVKSKEPVTMVWGSAHLPSFARKLRRAGYELKNEKVII